MTVHYAGIQLHHSNGIGDAAVADGVNRGIVFNRLSPGYGSIERWRAFLQEGRGGFHSRLSKGPCSDHHVFCHVQFPSKNAGNCVDFDYRIIHTPRPTC
jgi:hypothetical protein